MARFLRQKRKRLGNSFFSVKVACLAQGGEAHPAAFSVV